MLSYYNWNHLLEYLLVFLANSFIFIISYIVCMRRYRLVDITNTTRYIYEEDAGRYIGILTTKNLLLRLLMVFYGAVVIVIEYPCLVMAINLILGLFDSNIKLSESLPQFSTDFRVIIPAILLFLIFFYLLNRAVELLMFCLFASLYLRYRKCYDDILRHSISISLHLAKKKLLPLYHGSIVTFIENFCYVRM